VQRPLRPSPAAPPGGRAGRGGRQRGLGVQSRLLVLGMAVVVATALALSAVGVLQARSFSIEAHRHVDSLVDAGLAQATRDAVALVEAQSRAVQAKVDSDLRVARHVLHAAGPVTFSADPVQWTARNQYSGEVTEVRLPRMLVGGQWLGQNTNPAVRTPVVDEIADLVGGTVTVFRRVNDEGDMLRVATNVRTADGQRAVGTYIPAVNPDGITNPVVSTLLAGQTYRGVAYVVNDWYVTAYEPLLDADGQLIGALYVGVRQDNLDTLRSALSRSQVGHSGTVTVLRGSGAQLGQEVLAASDQHADPRRGEHTRQMAAVGGGLAPDEVRSGTYTVARDGTTTPMVYRVAYYAPWDYVIAVETPRSELSEVQAAVNAGQRAMTSTLLLVGVAVSVLGATGTALVARRLTGLQAQLTHQAFHDALTGLANRSLFADRVEQALLRATRSGNAVGVLFLDLDDFKTVNDSLGHDAGDQLLVQVAHRLRGALRSTDTPARLGGDEFAVLVEDLSDAADVELVADRLLRALSAPFLLASTEVLVRSSIGLATNIDDLSDGGRLLSAADAAMYAAKTAGKGRCAVFTPTMTADAAERLQLRADLDRAVDRGELVVHYQPTVHLSSGRIRGVEALVRWQHPTRGLLHPGQFITLAEQTGLIVPLGWAVLQQACTQAAQWRAAHPDFDLAVTVNLAAAQLRHADCTRHVAGALTASGLDPTALTLEITESVLMGDDAEQQLADLTQLGVKLAVDDFGTGYSSLSYLSRFPIGPSPLRWTQGFESRPIRRE
jgi:diguanylate cyclase (GGDEF)-like protein